MQNVNTQDILNTLNVQTSGTLFMSLNYLRDKYNPFIPQQIFNLFYTETTRAWNKIDRSEERMLPHVKKVAFLSPFTRSASRKTLANSAKSKSRIINATILFLSY